MLAKSFVIYVTIKVDDVVEHLLIVSLETSGLTLLIVSTYQIQVAHYGLTRRLRVKQTVKIRTCRIRFRLSTCTHHKA